MNILNKYRNDGYGMHSFKDQVDKTQYIYTKFEPSFSHYVYPNFDQPDIKAKWIFSAIFPYDWVLISNELQNLNVSQKYQNSIFSNLESVSKTFGKHQIFS